MLTFSFVSSSKKVWRSEKSRSVRQRLLFSDSILAHSSVTASSTLNRFMYITANNIGGAYTQMKADVRIIKQYRFLKPPVLPLMSESLRRPPWP